MFYIIFFMYSLILYVYLHDVKMFKNCLRNQWSRILDTIGKIIFTENAFC